MEVSSVLDLEPGSVDRRARLVRIAALATRHRWTIATAESCTGGLVASALTEIAGASNYVSGGVVAYSRAAKVRLGVSEAVIDGYGIVSSEVALALANCARGYFGASIGVGVTGAAGPAYEGHTPAGVIDVACMSATQHLTIRLEGDHGRSINRLLAVDAALKMIEELLGAGGV